MTGINDLYPSRRGRRDVGARGIQRTTARAAAERIAHRLRGGQFRRPSYGHGRDGPAAGRAGAMSIEQAATRIRSAGIWGFWKVDRINGRPVADLPYAGRAAQLPCERHEASRELLLEVSGQAQRQGNDRQSGVARSSGREHRTPGNVEICHGMHAAILIDDTLRRIAVHARSSHMVVVRYEVFRPGIVLTKRGAQPAKSRASDLSPEEANNSGGFAPVFSDKAPVNDNLPHTQLIAG
jgi:hypothetical protein